MNLGAELLKGDVASRQFRNGHNAGGLHKTDRMSPENKNQEGKCQ